MMKTERAMEVEAFGCAAPEDRTVDSKHCRKGGKN